jgi:hypothetical protein
MEKKWAQIRGNLNFFPQLPEFHEKFQYVAKNIKGFGFFVL